MADSFAEITNELHNQGYCILKNHFAPALIDDCREAFLPVLESYFKQGPSPNRGANRYFVPMPFEQPCFASQFFFDAKILGILKNIMGDRIVADQWGCDVPLFGSGYQAVHVDYQRPLFYEMPELNLPAYMMVVS